GASLDFAGLVVATQLVKDLYQFLVGDAVVGIDGLGFPEPLQGFFRPVLLGGNLGVEVISADKIGMKRAQTVQSGLGGLDRLEGLAARQSQQGTVVFRIGG